MKLSYFAISVAFLYSWSCWGGRISRSLPINILSLHEFERDRLGNVTTSGPTTGVYGSPQRVGSKAEMILSIVNMGDVAQAGSVSFLSASGVTARASCQKDGAIQYLKGHLYLCLPGSSNSSAGTTIEQASGRVAGANLPAAVAFTLPASGAIRILATFISEGTFGDPPNGCKASYVDFTSALEIRVNDDRGAVAASITPRVSNIANYSSSPQKYCEVGQSFDNTYAGFYENLPMTPIMINGGRPF